MTDLHMHSRYSEDGELTPAELVGQCYRLGITTMSITDHNCARARRRRRAFGISTELRSIVFTKG